MNKFGSWVKREPGEPVYAHRLILLAGLVHRNGTVVVQFNADLLAIEIMAICAVPRQQLMRIRDGVCVEVETVNDRLRMHTIVRLGNREP